MKKLTMFVCAVFVFALFAAPVRAEEKATEKEKATEAKKATEAVSWMKQRKKKEGEFPKNEYYSFCQYFTERFKAAPGVQSLCASLGVTVEGKPDGVPSIGGGDGSSDPKYWALVDKAKDAQTKADELYKEAEEYAGKAAEYKKEIEDIQQKLAAAEKVGMEKVDEAYNNVEGDKKALDDITSQMKKIEEEFQKKHEEDYKKIDALYKEADELEKKGDKEGAEKLRKEAAAQEAKLAAELDKTMEGSGLNKKYDEMSQKLAEQQKELESLYAQGGMTTEEYKKTKEYMGDVEKTQMAYHEQADDYGKQADAAQDEANKAWDAVSQYASENGIDNSNYEGMGSGGSSGEGEGEGEGEGGSGVCVEKCKKACEKDGDPEACLKKCMETNKCKEKQV